MKWRDRLADWISGGELTRARANAVAWFNAGQIDKFRAGALAGEVEDLNALLGVYKRGKVFMGPNGHGYELTRDVNHAEPIVFNQFKPIGGAPQPVAGDLIPDWLLVQIGAREPTA